MMKCTTVFWAELPQKQSGASCFGGWRTSRGWMFSWLTLKKRATETNIHSSRGPQTAPVTSVKNNNPSQLPTCSSRVAQCTRSRPREEKEIFVTPWRWDGLRIDLTAEQATYLLQHEAGEEGTHPVTVTATGGLVCNNYHLRFMSSARKIKHRLRKSPQGINPAAHCYSWLGKRSSAKAGS